LNSTARIIVVGIVVDVIYQYIELKTFYPIEALLVVLALAFAPYFMLRGPIRVSPASGAADPQCTT
jgi:EamA domain-containing membrane protein RarD